MCRSRGRHHPERAERLTLNADFNKEKKKYLRGGRSASASPGAPWTTSSLTSWAGSHVEDKRTVGYAAAMMALVIATLIATRKRELRPPFIVAALAGLAWVFPMRGLTAFHDFTNMFLLSMTVVLMAGIASLLPAAGAAPAGAARVRGARRSRRTRATRSCARIRSGARRTRATSSASGPRSSRAR